MNSLKLNNNKTILLLIIKLNKKSKILKFIKTKKLMKIKLFQSKKVII